eukprot:10498745-Prorocentrum_lima.AAC.1
MTSSLVGSEMCIRDRNDPIKRRFLPPLPPPALTALGGAGLVRTTPLNAVSYTHLTLPTICSV